MQHFFTFTFIVIFLSTSFVRGESLRFSVLDKEDGLPNNVVKELAQDRHGMIWIATVSGVVRYDGMSFQKFENDIHDSTSVNRQILDIFVDENGVVWCATPVGLQSFDEETETFKSYNLRDYRDAIFFSYITEIEQYSDDTLLLTSRNEGPLLFSTKTGDVEYLHQTVMRNFLPKNTIYSHCISDSNGNIFMWTKHNGFFCWNRKNMSGDHVPINNDHTRDMKITQGYDGEFWFPMKSKVGVYNAHTKKVREYPFQVSDTLANVNEYTVMQFYDDKLYLGSVGDGLFIIDTTTWIANRYRNNPKNEFSIPDNGLNSLFQDRSNNIWIGTSANGLAVLKSVGKQFDNQVVMTDCQFSRCNFVNDYIQTPNGDAWAAMDGAGLNIKSRTDSEFKTKLSFPGYRVHGVTALANGSDGNVWVGTFRHGLFLMDTNQNVLQVFDTSLTTSLTNRFSSNFIKSVLVASNDYIWVATNGGGVYLIDEKGILKHNYFLDPKNTDKSISCSDATCFFEDSKKNIWVGTFWGLNLFSRDGKFIRQWVNDELRLSNISSNVIHDVVEDGNGDIWVATMYGVNRLRHIDSMFTCYSASEGLVNNNVQQLQVDDDGNVWIATSDGLSKYDVEKNKFYSFYKFDGMISSTFRHTSYKDKMGKLYFGTDQGIVSFYPQNIDIDTLPPNVLITEFRLFNKRVLPGASSIIDTIVNEAERIELSHDENYIGFRFSSQNFVDYEKVRFKYRLVGADKDWVETDVKRRFADYSNLSPGDYLFQVKATNNDGVWSQYPIELAITIVPPFYKTALFRSAFILFFLIGLILFVRYREKKLSHDKQLLEEMVAERTRIIAAKTEEIQEQNEQLKVLNHTKDTFFSIIAHDLKNPLNALMGFSGLLNDKYEDLPDSKKRKFISVINDSSRGMYGLLVNLLDWARSQTGNIQFEPATHNMFPIVEESIILITSQAEQKNITIVNKIQSDAYVYADINMVKTILRNMLANALKFSFRDDSIEIGLLQKKAGKTTLYVKDNGVGMTKEACKKVFSTNAGETTLGTEKEKGSGLGLIVCKEFAHLNKGEIWCESEQGSGTTFYVDFCQEHTI